MTINKILDGKTLTVIPEGRLDTMTTSAFSAELDQSLGDAEQLIIDCSKLEYTSSAGLRALLTAHKTMSTKGGMKLTNVNEIVQAVLNVTGLSDIFTIECTAD